MTPIQFSSRRRFLRTSILTGVAAMSGTAWAPRRLEAGQTEPSPSVSSRVALTAGEDRANNTFRALQPFAQEIKAAIGNRRVVIKPNNVAIDNQLAATHADCLEGILEFLKSIGKSGQVVIAESAANGPTLDGYANYGYGKVAAKYQTKMVDLDRAETAVLQVFDETDFHPHPVRVSSLLLDRNNYLISAAKLKTHDRIVATLSLKNIVLGAPIKDQGFRWGPGGRAGAKTDKPIVHGSGFRGLNFNLFALAQRLRPDLAVIDGYRGMEGNGPVGGSAVEHRVCAASTDWLAADRVGIELMGIDFTRVGYLNYCTQAKLGQGELSKIEVVGERVTDHVKRYRLHDNVNEQMIWQRPVEKG